MINHIYRLITLANYKKMRNNLAFFVLFLLKNSALPPNSILHKESIVSSRPPRLFSLCHAFIVICLLILTGVTQESRAEKLSTEEWNISADKVINYENPNSIVAKGNVVLEKKTLKPLRPPAKKAELSSWTELLEEKIEPPEIKADEIIDKTAAVYQTTVTVKADWIVYDVELESIKAKGNVQIITADDQLQATEASIKLTDETGRFTDATITRKEHSLHLEGKSIEKTGFDTYRIKDGWVITCKIEDGEVPPWSFSSSEVDVRPGGYAFLKHAKFNIKNVPVFYTPYLVVPIKNTRQTGFLFPEFSSSNSGGFAFNLPFFWNISESIDATFFPEFYLKRGFMPGVEFRYIEKANEKGIFSANYLDDTLSDPSETDYYDDTGFTHTNSDRYWLRGKADHIFGDHWYSRLDIDIVSDQDYLTEFKAGSTGFNSNQEKYLETFGRGFQTETDPLRKNTFKLLRSWDGIAFETNFLAISEAESDPIDINTPLWKLPSLDFTGAIPIGETFLTFDWNADYVNYWREDGIGGHRVDLRPSIATPIPLSPYLESRAELGFRDTFYAVQKYGDAEWDRDDTQNRFLAEFETEVATTLERDFFSTGQTLRSSTNQIRPFIKYGYIQDADQDDLPIFDDIDTIDDLNAIAYGIDTFLDTFTYGKNNMERRREYAYLKIDQAYDLRNEASDEPFSDIYTQLGWRPTRRSNLSYKSYYDVYDNSFASHILESGYTNSRGDYFSLDYSYRPEDEIKQINAQIRTRIFNSWIVGAGIKHSIEFDQTDEAIASLTYQALCWSIRLEALYTPYDTTFTVLFDLANIGKSIGFKY